MDDQARAERVRSIEQLARRITEFTGHMNAATYHWLTMISEFDRLKGWSDGGTHSCAHWLNWKCGIALGAAREKVRVARALEHLPKTAAAMERGELSYSNARAITRVACPDTEASLLMIARHGTAEHVERMVRAFRRCKESAELSREAQQQANRHLKYRYADDGSLVLEARLPAETGALMLKALEAALPDVPEPEPPKFEHRDISAETLMLRIPSAKRRADALAAIAESFLKHGMEALSGGERHQIVVHVDADTLRDCSAGRCEIEEGTSMAAATARRLACDASVVALIESEQGEPIDAGRKTRTISPGLRRVLNARDKGCRFPGCTHTRFVDAHHIHHWADGGATKPSNLVSLCRRHHRAVHEEGFQIQVLDDGALRFLRPDGRVLDSIALGHTHPLGNWQWVPARNEERGIQITTKTATTRWAGEKMDYGLATELLMQRLAKRRSAATHATVASGAIPNGARGKCKSNMAGVDEPRLERSS